INQLASQLNMEIVERSAFRFGAHNPGLSNAVLKDHRAVCNGNPFTINTKVPGTLLRVNRICHDSRYKAYTAACSGLVSYRKLFSVGQQSHREIAGLKTNTQNL
ncbi:hypothetical protein, partial [Ruegeria arenilitoris]